MQTIRRFICKLFGHTSLPGVDRRWTFLHWCPRCRSLVEGRVRR